METLNEYGARVFKAVTDNPEAVSEKLSQIFTLLLDAYASGSTIYIMGNGGMAATANHFICDLVKGTVKGGWNKRFKAVSLCADIALLSAIINDTSDNWVGMYSTQLWNCRENDILIALSVSGSSPNIVQAVRVAKERGMKVVSFIGNVKVNGRFGIKILKKRSDILVRFPSEDYQVVEDATQATLHYVFQQLRERLKEKLDNR